MGGGEECGDLHGMQAHSISDEIDEGLYLSPRTESGVDAQASSGGVCCLSEKKISCDSAEYELKLKELQQGLEDRDSRSTPRAQQAISWK